MSRPSELHRSDTGSVRLGRELRRLRGSRSLADVASESATDPFARSARSISIATLSFAENGHVMPSLDALHTLSLAYGVPLLGLVETALLEAPEDGALSPDQAREAHERAVGAGDWLRAAELARQLEGAATCPSEAVRWRIEHARCVLRVGAHEDAVFGLLRLLEDGGLSREERLEGLIVLCDAADQAGLALFGLDAALAARLLLCRDTPAPTASRVHAHVARFVATCHERSLRTEEHLVHEALRSVVAARAACGSAGAASRFLLDVLDVRLRLCLGNALHAGPAFQRLAEEAREAKVFDAAASALVHLGRLRARQERAAEARVSLEAAASLALAQGLPALAFEAHYELYRLAPPREPGLRRAFLAQCRRAHPMLVARTPELAEFERLLPEEVPPPRRPWQPRARLGASAAVAAP